VTLPAFAAERACSWYAAPVPAAIDCYLLPAGRSAANPPAAAAAASRRCCCQSMGQTDGQTVTQILLLRPVQ